MAAAAEGWTTVPLTDIAEVIMGQSPPGSTYNDHGDGLPFFQGKSEFGEDHPRAMKWCSAPTRIAEPGDILMSVRAPVGPTNVADQRCAIGRGLAIIRPKVGVPVSLLRHAIKLQEDEIASWGTGTTFSAINKGHFKEIMVSLPPDLDRDPLASLLDETVTLRRSSARHLAAARRSIVRFRGVVLAAACSGLLTADWRDKSDLDAWTPMPLGHLIRSLDQGWSPQCENSPAPLADWGVIKTTAVQPGRFVENENKRLPASLDPRPELELESGDLLMTRAGPRTRVGVACLIRQVRPRLILCDKIYRLRANASAIMPELLEIVLNDPVRLIEIDDLKTGTSESGMNLTHRKVRELIIQVPPLDEQLEIVRRVEELLRLAHGLRARIDAASKRIDRSSQAILAKGFRGELVGNGHRGGE